MSAWQTKHNHKTSRALNLIVIIENSAPSVRHHSSSIPAERSQSAYMRTRSHQSSHMYQQGLQLSQYQLYILLLQYMPVCI